MLRIALDVRCVCRITRLRLRRSAQPETRSKPEVARSAVGRTVEGPWNWCRSSVATPTTSAKLPSANCTQWAAWRARLCSMAGTSTPTRRFARCNALLPKANAEEFQARLDTFLADTEGKYEHSLPGWRQFRAVVRGEVTMFGWTHVSAPRSR